MRSMENVPLEFRDRTRYGNTFNKYAGAEDRMPTITRSRREFLRDLGFGAACLASAGLVRGEPPARPRPNIIVLLCDDLGYGDLGCYGHPVIKSPVLDQFAREGVRFTAFYAAAPNCSPSRAGLLTGRTPYRMGMYDVIGKPGCQLSFPDSESTIAEVLGAAGYDTCHFGKWHLDSRSAGSDNKTKPSDVVRHGFKRSYPDTGSATDTVRTFQRWASEHQSAEQPFFAYIGLHETHEPVELWSPQSYRRLYRKMSDVPVPDGSVPRNNAKPQDRPVYYGCVSQLDAAFGNLLEFLEKSGLRENTAILFTSDNGPDDRCPHSFGSPGPFRGTKGRVYEGGIRVPALLQWPGKLPAGMVCDEPVHGVDVLPTLCALAGVPLPQDHVLDGVDFTPALEGQPLKRTEPLYWGMWDARGGVQYAIRDGDWKLLAGAEPLKPEVKIIDHIKNGKIVRYELYNLRTDPGETRDLSETEPEALKRMIDRFTPLHAQILAEGPRVDLEEKRGKARWAWPEAYGLNPADEGASDDE